MPKKMRQGALRSALSERVREGKVTLIDNWSLAQPKTREFTGALRALGYEGKTLIVDSFDNENLMLSTRNVQSAKVVNSFGLNIYDLLYHEQLIISEAAVKELEQLLGPKSENGGEAASEEPLEAAPGEEAKPKRTRKTADKPAKAAPKRKKKETA
jgi:large subunit ribosomal protein L4